MPRDGLWRSADLCQSRIVALGSNPFLLGVDVEHQTTVTPSIETVRSYAERLTHAKRAKRTEEDEDVPVATMGGLHLRSNLFDLRWVRDSPWVSAF